MGSQDLMSINTVAARLGLSVHQLRRWELMFGLDIKRGRGQQRQYRPEDMTVLERIKELVEQGWPTSQIRPQIEAEGLITPRLIGVPQQPGNPEVVLESIIGFRNFSERRFIEISKQIDELRQLVISITLKQELAGEADSPWKPVAEEEDEVETDTEPIEAIPERPAEEITLGPQIAVSTDMQTRQTPLQPAQVAPPISSFAQPDSDSEFAEDFSDEDENENPVMPAMEALDASVPETQSVVATSTPVTQPATASPKGNEYHIDEVTDQNYLTVLGKALDLIGWTDEQADEFAEKTYQVPHWDELGRSHAEKMVAHIKGLLSDGGDDAEEVLEEAQIPLVSEVITGPSESSTDISIDSISDVSEPTESVSEQESSHESIVEPSFSIPESQEPKEPPAVDQSSQSQIPSSGQVIGEEDLPKPTITALTRPESHESEAPPPAPSPVSDAELGSDSDVSRTDQSFSP